MQIDLTDDQALAHFKKINPHWPQGKRPNFKLIPNKSSSPLIMLPYYKHESDNTEYTTGNIISILNHYGIDKNPTHPPINHLDSPALTFIEMTIERNQGRNEKHRFNSFEWDRIKNKNWPYAAALELALNGTYSPVMDIDQNGNETLHGYIIWTKNGLQLEPKENFQQNLHPDRTKTNLLT